jgi:hypothetical protein
MSAPTDHDVLPSAPVRAGDLLAGRYRVERVLGAGGMGVVVAARHVALGERVAVKFLLPGGAAHPDTLARFLREGRAAARIRSEHVARVYDAGVLESGDPYLVLEYLEGSDLAAVLRARGPLPPGEAALFVLQACEGLAAAHARGIVHRDLKPGNLFLTRRAEGSPRVVVIDFGVSKLTLTESGERGLSHTGTAVALGTPYYMAPEQMRLARSVDARADIWSLGAVLYKLLTGEHPFSGNSLVEIYERTASGPPSLRAARPDAPPALEAIIARCLLRDPASRFADVAELAEALASEAPEGGAAAADRVAQILRAAPPAPSGEEAGDPAPLASPARERGASTVTAPPRGISWAEPMASDAFARGSGASIADVDQAPPEILTRPPIVGRKEEVALLARAAAEAAAGSVRVVVIAGALGVGRTRMLEASLEEAGAPPDRVIRMDASPERQSPLRPLRRALERESAPALDPLRSAALRAVTPAALPGAHDAEEAVEGVLDALVRASLAEPLVLAIDDLQWADAHTLSLVRLLVERADAGGPGRLLVVATTRHEPHPQAALRALLGRVRATFRPEVRYLALAPLSHAEALELAQAACPLAPELAQAVARGSGGLPLLVIHALVAFRELGAIAFRGRAFRAVDERALREKAPGVAELLETRLASYIEPGSPAERAALRALAAVALAGGGLGFEALSAACGDDGLEAALEALAAAGVLARSGPAHEYGFGQEMVRQAALQLAAQRPWFPRLHRALLDAIAEGPGAAADAAFLASGYERLGASEPARRWLRRAMDDAIAGGLFEDAVDLGDRLAALVAEPEARAAVELDIARALLRGRRFEDASARLFRLRARGAVEGGGWRAVDVRARVYRLEAARGLRESGVEDPAVVDDADAIADLPLRCEARLGLAGVTRGPRSLALAGEAVEIASRHSPALEFTARVLRAELCYEALRPDLELARGDLQRALLIAEATESTWQQIHIAGDLAVIEAELGELDPAIDQLYRLAEQADALGMRGQLRLSLQSLAAFLLRAGRAPEAAAVAGRVALLASEAGDTALKALGLSLRADALQRAGDSAAALEAADEAVKIQRAREDGMEALTLLRRAEIQEALGRSGEALADARSARQVADRYGERDLAIGALLWEALHLAETGAAEAGALARALSEAEASGVTFRERTKNLAARARSWLESRNGPSRSS